MTDSVLRHCAVR